jgi:hypothetical protein
MVSLKLKKNPAGSKRRVLGVGEVMSVTIAVNRLIHHANRRLGALVLGLAVAGLAGCTGPALVAYQAVSFVLTGAQVADLANRISEADMPYTLLGGRWRAKDRTKTILVVDNIRNRLQVGQGRHLLLQGSLAVVKEKKKTIRLRVFTGRHRPSPELAVRFIKKDLISASFTVEGKKRFTELVFHRIKPGKKPPVALIPRPGSQTDGSEAESLLAAEANAPLDRPLPDEGIIAKKFPETATANQPAGPGAGPAPAKVPPPPPGSIPPRRAASPLTPATPHTVPAPAPSPYPAPVKPPQITPTGPAKTDPKNPGSFFAPGGS